MNRLPGSGDPGDDRDGYMTATDVVEHLDRYRALVAAPVVDHTTVTAVRHASPGFTVGTDRGRWRCRAVMVATGAAGTAHIPL